MFTRCDVCFSHPGVCFTYMSCMGSKLMFEKKEEWTTCLHCILFFHLARVGMAGYRDCCMQGEKKEKKMKTGLNACPIHIHTTVVWATSRVSRAAGPMNPRWIYALFSGPSESTSYIWMIASPFSLIDCWVCINLAYRQTVNLSHWPSLALLLK